MPPDDFNALDRTHVTITELRETKRFKVPTSPQSRKALRENYAAHATLLLNQLAAIFAANLPASDAPRLRIETLKPGTLVSVETKPPTSVRAGTQKVPQGLEFPGEEIVILRSERAADRTERALLFVPDEAQVFLRGRLTEYGRDPGNQSRPHLDRFEAVERFSEVAPQQLFVGRVDLTTPEPSWWELWVSGPRVRADSLAGQARAAHLDVHHDRLIFPDTTVLFVHAGPSALLRFVGQMPGAIAEIRAASGTIEPFLERHEGRVGQHEYTDELAARLRPPPAGAPAVCVLDTGVSAAHPLLRPGLRGTWAYDAAWGPDDDHRDGGHGTPLTGLVLHGDLEPLMNGAGPVAMTHDAESMKLLPPRGFPQTEPDAWGLVTQGAVALTETVRPGILRSFCLASSSPLFPPREPSSWSGALDQIAAGAMPGEGPNSDEEVEPPRRLVLVATGNRNGGQRADIEPLGSLEDPAQSWNALSIGGFTRKAQPAAGLTPVVPANHRSPYSLGSHTLPHELTPIKPEVLFEAGNMLADQTDFCGWHEAVSLLAPGSDVVQEPLVPFFATSAAVGMAGHFAGRLQAALPALWPETHRALTVDSAAWTEPMLARVISRGAHWKGGQHGTSAQRQAFLREFGYGVPDLERAIRSARNDVTLLAEAEIQPFTTGTDRRGVFNEMHFYRLPWPRATLQGLGDETVTMKVTLSYFIEPNLTGRAATRPDTYRSFGLRFAMKKRRESEAHFRGRINADQARDPTLVETGSESSRWLLGPKAVQAGSLHCDVWRGRAVELAGHDGIGVFPVSGWWKSHIGQRRVESKARYALAISISAAGHSVDLHAEVSTEVAARTQAEIEVPAV